jgi:hypothetical protein
MSMRSLIVAIVLFLITLPSLLVAEQYKVKSRVHLQGDSGWDYLTVDPESRELYVTHGTELQIVNLDSQEPIAKVAGMKRIHGVAIVKDLNRGFVSDGGDNAVVIFDLKSHSILNKVPTGKNPDAILYDPFSKRIFVFNGASDDVTVIEADSAAVAGAPEEPRIIIPGGGFPQTRRISTDKPLCSLNLVRIPGWSANRKLSRNGLVGTANGRSKLSTTRKYGRLDTMNSNTFCFASPIPVRFG